MEITSKTNIDEIQAEMERLRAKGYGMAPLFEEIANHLYNLADEAFDDETSPDGDAWLPLSPLTIKRKGHDRKLHDSGSLRETLDFDSDKDSATVGVNAVSEQGYPYPAVQHFGTEDGRVPARPFFPFTEEGGLMDDAAESILALVREYFEA